MGAYSKIQQPENPYGMSNTFKLLLILSLIFGMIIGVISGLFLARKAEKTVVDNLRSHSISRHHSNDSVKGHSQPQLSHPKPSQRGRTGFYHSFKCRHDANLDHNFSLLPYKVNYSLTANRHFRSRRIEFLRHLDSGNQTLFTSIKFNPALTKGEIADNIKTWLQTLPRKVQETYTEWQANVTQRREQFAENIKANLTDPAIQLFHKILSIVDDRSLTRSETKRRIDETILNSTLKPWLELNRALGNAVCHRLDTSLREEIETQEELSEIEKQIQDYISFLPLLEDRNNKNKAFDGDTLLEKTIKGSLRTFKSFFGMDPVEPAPLEYGRSINNQ